MLYFCTLFDSNYVSRGLAMYQSLRDHCDQFCLYVFAFDYVCYELLSSLKLPGLIPISLREFEDKDLLEIKGGRTQTEYCWTCTPSIILYVLKNYDVDYCTYVDADIFFYDDPKLLLDEMGSSSILLTQHRYTTRYDKTDRSGKYCVQFMTFKNDEYGLKAVTWWRNACITWCYARVENGKFGDQKYLDDWLDRFEGVHDLTHLGGGVAPWNVQQYVLETRNGKVYGKELYSGREFPLVFYHFHNIVFFHNGLIDLGIYHLSKVVKQSLYLPYLMKIKALDNLLVANNSSLVLNAKQFRDFPLKRQLQFLYGAMRGNMITLRFCQDKQIGR